MDKARSTTTLINVDYSVTTSVMGDRKNGGVRDLIGLFGILVALAAFSTIAVAIPNPANSDTVNNSVILGENNLEDVKDILDQDALEKVIESRKLGAIIDKDKLEKVVDKSKVASRMEKRRLADILNLEDMIDLIENQQIEVLVGKNGYDDFGEFFQGEDFRNIEDTVDILQFTDKELGRFIKDERVADLLAHLKFGELNDILGKKVIKYTDLGRILDDERLAELIERDDTDDVVQVLRDEKLKDVIHKGEIKSISDIIDEGDLDKLLDNEDIAKALDGNDFGEELSDSELYSLLKNQKVGKLQPIMDEEDVMQFIDFEKVLNLAEGSSDFSYISNIIRNEFIGDVINLRDREDLGDLISDEDIGRLLKKRGFSLGYNRNNFPSLKMRNIITDRGLSILFEGKTIADIEHLVQSEDADDLRRLIAESKLDSIGEEELLEFISDRDIVHILAILGEEDLDSVLKDSVTNEELAKIMHKRKLDRVVSNRDLGILIKDESLGDFADLLDDASLGRALKRRGLANLIEDAELGRFLRKKNIEDIIDSVEVEGRHRDRYDRDRYKDREQHYRDGNRRYGHREGGRCSNWFTYGGLPDSGRYYNNSGHRVYFEEDYSPPISPDHPNHMSRYERGYSYDRNYRENSISYTGPRRTGCRRRDDITVREALGHSEREGSGDSYDSSSETSKKVEITQVATPKVINPDREFKISVRVSNNRDRSKRTKITAGIGKNSIGSKSVEVSSEGHKTVTFTAKYNGSDDDANLKIEAVSGRETDEFVVELNIATINAFLELSPEEIQAEENTLLKGQVEESIEASGVKTSANVYVNGEKRGIVSTDSNGKFRRHLKIDKAGKYTVKVQNSDFVASEALEVNPVIDVEDINAPSEIKAGESFKICGDILGRGVEEVEVGLFIEGNNSENRTVHTGGGSKQVCFERTFKGTGKHHIAVRAGLNSLERGLTKDIKVEDSLIIESRALVMEKGNWSDLKINVSNTISREREIRVYLADLEEGEAKEYVKNVTIPATSKSQVVFEIKPDRLGEYSVIVEASSERYTNSKAIRIRAESSYSITSQTLKWVDRKTGAIRSSKDLKDRTIGLWDYIYNLVRRNKYVGLGLLAIILVVAVVTKTRDILKRPNPLEPYYHQ